MEELFNYLNDVSINETIDEIIMISPSPSLSLKYTLEYTLNSTNSIYSEMPSSIFENEKILIYTDSSLKKTKKEFIEVFSDGLDVDIRIIINQELGIDHPSIYFLNPKVINEFLNQFLRLNITYLENLNYKINITTQNNSPSKAIFDDSSIFTLIKDHKEELTSETKEFINRFKNKKLIIALIPNILNIDELESSVFPHKETIKSILELLANSSEHQSYYFFGKYRLTLNYNNKLSISEINNILQQLTETFNFIYSDNRSADQKLTFYKKVICEFYKSDASIDLNDLADKSFFQSVLKETIYIYDAYEEGEISIFLKEKKEIIKEYLSISKEILKTANDFRNTLIKNILAVIAIFMGNYLLKISSTSNIIYIVILIYLLVLIILTSTQETLQIENFVKRKDLISKHFNFVNKESKELHKESNEMLISEIRILKYLVIFSISVYVVFLFVILLLILH